MIGDRERPDDPGEVMPEQFEAYGPMDAMVRMNPPLTMSSAPMPPVWVERYGAVVVIRQTWSDGSSTVSETPYPSEARALRGMAASVATLMKRDYWPVPSDDLPAVL